MEISLFKSSSFYCERGYCCLLPKKTQIMNGYLKSNLFLDVLNNDETGSSYFKNGNTGKKENYRPVSIFLNLSKVFKLICSQLNEFMETKFSKLLTGFWKNRDTQSALLRMIENWKTQLNKRNKVGVIIYGPV